MTFLVKQARNVARLMRVSAGPGARARPLPATDPKWHHRVHMYPRRPEDRCLEHAVAEGDFTLKPDGSGFEVARPLE